MKLLFIQMSKTEVEGKAGLRGGMRIWFGNTVSLRCIIDVYMDMSRGVARIPSKI